jgi:GNAT superfamily N-acetyltransferase
MNIRIQVEAEINPKMAALRQMSYDDYICGPDRFDGFSSHITAWCDSEPVGMVRLTQGPPFALTEWSGGAFQAPPGRGVIEMTRGVVHPEFRRAGIYKAVMLDALFFAHFSGLGVAIAAIQPDFVGRRFLESVGFSAFGKPCKFDSHFWAQPIRCDLSDVAIWRQAWEKHTAEMQARNVTFEPSAQTPWLEPVPAIAPVP